MAVAFATPGAIHEYYSLTGQVDPGVRSAHHNTVKQFFDLTESEDSREVLRAIGVSSPSSDAELYAHLRYQAWLAYDPHHTLASKSVNNPSWSFQGDDLVRCPVVDAVEQCVRMSSFVFDSSGALRSFTMNGFPIRELLVRPTENSTQTIGKVSMELLGGYPYATKNGYALVLVLKVSSSADGTSIDYGGALYDDSDAHTHTVGAAGRTELAQGQSTWAYVTGVPPETPWIMLPATSGGEKKSFWFSLY